MSSLKINQFKFITHDDYRDDRFLNWSRCYEWGYVLKTIKDSYQEKITVHNTCAGPGEIHKQFHDELIKQNVEVTNSDIVITEINKNFTNMCQHDLTKPWKNKEEFDLLLCISTLEEIPTVNKRFEGSYEERKKNLKQILENLYNQVKPNGRLIITLDYPDIDYEIFEDIFDRKISNLESKLLSPFPMSSAGELSLLSVILLDVEKL